MRLLIETEEPGNSRSLFRVTLDGKVVATGLTAVQAHLIAGDALERFMSLGRLAWSKGATFSNSPPLD